MIKIPTWNLGRNIHVPVQESIYSRKVHFTTFDSSFMSFARVVLSYSKLFVIRKNDFSFIFISFLKLANCALIVFVCIIRNASLTVFKGQNGVYATTNTPKNDV